MKPVRLQKLVSRFQSLRLRGGRILLRVLVVGLSFSFGYLLAQFAGEFSKQFFNNANLSKSTTALSSPLQTKSQQVNNAKSNGK